MRGVLALSVLVLPACGNSPAPRLAESAACESVHAFLARLPGLTVSEPRVADLASAWSGAGPRPGCQVQAGGRFVGPFASVDSLFAWLLTVGWRDNTIFSADGPDGTVQGFQRDGATCIVAARWDGGDDSDSTYVPSDTLDVAATCAATSPADTMLP
jgi:hypothetical protein